MMSSRVCLACQTSNPPQATFCFGCGRPLERVSTTPEVLHQRYHLLHKLGVGGFGAVYQAQDLQLGKRLVAVKEMSSVGAQGSKESMESVETFKKEALLLAELMHPGLPRIYDHFGENGRWYLVMDYIEGETLESYQERMPGGYLPLAEALDAGLQLCDVLDYLHSRQPPIIFRDLKPLNIMRTTAGHLYLIDFGIARHFTPGQATDTIAFGSPGYASPEQYGKAQTTPRSDIYSLGATLHQMLTGNDPSLTPFRFPPLSLPADQPPAPPSLATLIAHMLEIDELKRPDRIAIVKTELQDIAAQVANRSRVPSPIQVQAGTSAPASASPQPTNPPPSKTLTPAPTNLQSAKKQVPIAANPHISYGELRCTHQGLHQSTRALIWSPDSKLLASAGNSNVVDVWDATNGKRVRKYLAHQENIRALAWSPNGTYIASASEDKTVHVWEVATGRVLQVYKKHAHFVTGVSWSPDSRHVTSSSIDKSVQVWDSLTGYVYVTYERHREIVYCVAWSPDGQYIASGDYNAAIHVWSAMSGKHIFTYRGHSALIHTLGWSPDSQRIASGSYDTTVQVWEAAHERIIMTYHGHNTQVQSLSWSADGAYVVSCGGSKIVPIWDANEGQEIFAYKGHDVKPEAERVKPDLPYPHSYTQQFYQVIPPTKEVNVVTWSPDGQWIASGADDGAIHVWQA